jgi:murein DD-endopeptidase MepM/ murein hydrolase activator NlpD
LLLCLWPAACLGPARTRVRLPEGRPDAQFQMPLVRARVLSPFGLRRGEMHTGIDLKDRKRGGDPVYASRAGRVVEVRSRGGYGNMVLIRHEDGYYTRYAHLRSVLVREGRAVGALEPVGTVGATGRATTPHLHFEILTPERKPVDPAPYLFQKDSP